MKYIIVILISLSLFFACKNNESPSQNNAIKIISNNVIDAKSYDVPEGVFRGALWPSPDEPNFTIWVIRENKELFFKLPAPQEIACWKKKVSELWEIHAIEDLDTTKRYSAKRTGNMTSVLFELPKKKRDYSFYVLTDEMGTESIIFMDISEDISDKGLFGYIIVNLNN